MLQKGGVLVSTDISEEMIKLAKLKFEDPEEDYNKIPGNKFEVRPEELLSTGEKSFNLEEYLKTKEFNDQNRFVLACIANNEYIPF